MVRVVATASCNVLDPADCQDGDRAPDSGQGYAYRIEG
jgi:hypothetical protein